VHINGDYYTNFADASATVTPEAHLIYRYGQAIGDHDMAAFGAWSAQFQPDGGAGGWGRPIESPMRWLRMIFSAAEVAQAEAYPPQPRDVWLPVISSATAIPPITPSSSIRRRANRLAAKPRKASATIRSGHAGRPGQST